TLTRLPINSDSFQIAVTRILASIMACSYNVSPNLLPLLVFKLINISVQYGNSTVSCFAYSCYGLILCGIAGEIDTGYQFGEIALKLLDCFDNKEQQARTTFVVDFFIRHWKEHFRNTLKSLLDTFQSAY